MRPVRYVTFTANLAARIQKELDVEIEKRKDKTQKSILMQAGDAMQRYASTHPERRAEIIEDLEIDVDGANVMAKRGRTKTTADLVNEKALELIKRLAAAEAMDTEAKKNLLAEPKRPYTDSKTGLTKRTTVMRATSGARPVV